MTTAQPELSADVRRLFEELIELPPLERRSRLGELGAELSRQVSELVRAAEEAPDFLERPAAESELVGHSAGPWILEQRLSSGGTGDVYQARRAGAAEGWRVAVKVLRRRDESGAVLARFQAERRSLAALNHPYIVPLIDAGSLADGRPFLATKLVQGSPLDRFAADLGLERRLRLFLAVCAAVQHAHERLVAHCDLKPANILVTGEGIPQLLDFGIARLLSEEALPGKAALTPGYASPEQLAGAALGTASDVWSLGVLLHELATGRRPFESAPRADRLAPSAAVLSTSAPRAFPPPAGDPARLARRLRGDFDALVARALALDPRERYGSVERLARDLESFLAARPVSARPPSPPRRAWLFVRRHRAGSAAAMVALASLALGAGAMYRDLQRTRAEASAGWRAHTAAALAAGMIEDLVLAAHGGAPPGPELERALDQASAELLGEPELLPETEGRLRIALGALYLESGRSADARVHLERARELTATTRGFGRNDAERIRKLLERCAGPEQGSPP